MKQNERTMMVYFPDVSHASNLRVFQDQTSQIRGFYFTKSQVATVEKLEYASNHAVYFLIAGAEEPSIYIGQSVNGIERIKSHLREKEFWQYCLMFVTDNNSFDKLSIDYLEYYFIREFSKTHYSLENKEIRTIEPNVNMFNKSTLLMFASHIEFLLEASGVSLKKEEGCIDKSTLTYYVAPSPYDAKIFIRDGKFVLAEGSVIRKPSQRSKNWNDGGRFHEKQLKHFKSFIDTDQAIALDGESARLLSDIEFNSPSAPAELCSGTSQNGWQFWIDLERERM